MNRLDAMQPKTNAAWPYQYNGNGFRFITNDFGELALAGQASGRVVTEIRQSRREA